MALTAAPTQCEAQPARFFSPHYIAPARPQMLHTLSGFALLASAAVAALDAGGAANHARQLSEIPVAVTPPPSSPPPQVGLLCPPNTDHFAILFDPKSRGAIAVNDCWDMRSVTSADDMFNGKSPPEAIEFDLATAITAERMFNTGQVTGSMGLTGLDNVVTTSYMFGGTQFSISSLSLEGLGSTGRWVTSDNMFQGSNFNVPIDAIGDTSAVINFAFMFGYDESFNQPVTVLNTVSTTSLAAMFRNNRAFNHPVDHFVTTSVTNLSSVFHGCSVFNQPVEHFVTTSVTKLHSTFRDTNDFDQPIGGWNTSSVTNIYYMFRNARAFSQELAAWDVSKVVYFNGMFTESRMRDEAVAGGPGFGRACRIHHSWTAQNAVWDPVVAGLVADATELELSLCAPYLAGGALQGDPHLGLAHGGKADFCGCDGCLFNFLSTRDVAVNARLRATTFMLNGSEVHGTFVTEVHMATLDRGLDRWFNASYWAEEVGEGNWGWKAVNGSCGGVSFPLFPHHTFTCGASSAKTAHSSAVFALPEWEVSVQSRPVYDRIDGPKHRLDLSLRPLLPEARLVEWPHGLIGQSFDGDARPRQGKQDDYSTPVVWTTAQAEGAIEGVADDYRVAAPFATEFRFSRFDPLSGGKRDPAPVPKSAWAPPPGVVPGVATPGVLTGVATAGDA